VGALEKEFGFVVPDAERKALGDLLGPVYGDNHFGNLIRFMAGKAPGEVDETDRAKAGSEQCISLVYEGDNAVSKIRDVLGPTDPSKAPSGTIRREFGQSIMVNAAHASDSPASAEREIGIIYPGANHLRSTVEAFYGPLG
jgi:Nucleoside diphosphate kinase